MRTAPCREIRDQLIEAARAGSLTTPLLTHVAQCGDCAGFLNGQVRLSRALAVVAEESQLEMAPLRIEAALFAELDRRRVPVRRSGYRTAVLGGAIAAALVTGVVFRPHSNQIVATPVQPTVTLAEPAPVVVEASTTPLRPKRRLPVRRPAHSPETVADVNSSPFIELPWTVPLAPGESASVVRMNLAVSALIAAGLSVDADPTGAAAADVVVGMDGRARAVRLVSISDTVNSNRRMQ